MDKTKVFAVCIDDFALKKRQRYGTDMVDAETHKIVDMPEGRETEDVKRWLGEYPNIRVVSRDGSMAYAAAITAAHPKATQIIDRFHLIKNLTDRATDALQKLFQGRIAIPVTDETRRLRIKIYTASKAECVSMLNALCREGRSKSELSQLAGLSPKTISRYLAMPETAEDPQTVRGRQHEDAVKKLQERAMWVRIMHESGCSIAAISQSTGFTHMTMKNYLSDSFSPVNGRYGKGCEGKLEPFRSEVLQMRQNGSTYRQMYEHIHAKGYNGTQDAIRGFISKEIRLGRDFQAQSGGEIRIC